MLFYGLVSVLVSLIVIFITYYKWSFQYWSRRNVPTLPPRIPFGNLQSPSRKDRSIGFQIKTLYDQAKAKRWKHCGLFFYASPVYLVLDREYLKNVMTKDFQHFVDRGMYYNEKNDPISAHLFALGGEKWKSLRSKLSPTFTGYKLKNMFSILVDCVSLLLVEVERKSEKIDVKELSGRFTTDVIGSCAFGLDCNTFQDDNSPFRYYGKKVFYTSRLRTLKLSLASNFPTLARFFGVRMVSKDVSDFYEKIVKDTIEYRKKNNYTRPDFMQMLLDLKNEDGNGLNLDEIVAQSFIFFLGGFETSSTTMTFTLYELAKNLDIQERLRKEILTTLEQHQNQITYEAISEMKYLDQIIDESLRKYPPFPFITRKCVEDYKVPDVDCIIKKDRRIIIPILAIHYDEEYYPDPEKFDPDRFSESNKSNIPSFAYIPFGEGPRICIGMRFGLMQTKVGLVALLKHFRFSVNPKTKNPIKMATNSFITTAQGGIWLDSKRI